MQRYNFLSINNTFGHEFYSNFNSIYITSQIISANYAFNSTKVTYIALFSNLSLARLPPTSMPSPPTSTSAVSSPRSSTSRSTTCSSRRGSQPSTARSIPTSTWTTCSRRCLQSAITKEFACFSVISAVSFSCAIV